MLHTIYFAFIRTAGVLCFLDSRRASLQPAPFFEIFQYVSGGLFYVFKLDPEQLFFLLRVVLDGSHYVASLRLPGRKPIREGRTTNVCRIDFLGKLIRYTFFATQINHIPHCCQKNVAAKYQSLYTTKYKAVTYRSKR